MFNTWQKRENMWMCLTDMFLTDHDYQNIILEGIINFSSRVCSHVRVQCPHKSTETPDYTRPHVATSPASPAGTNSLSNQHR